MPVFGPSIHLDFELELGIWIGPGNAQGEPIPIAHAGEHVVGLCMLNDWSARGWSEEAYWVPDPGSIQEAVSPTPSPTPQSRPTTSVAATASAPGVAVLSADVLPAEDGMATRGIGVVRRNEGGLSEIGRAHV